MFCSNTTVYCHTSNSTSLENTNWPLTCSVKAHGLNPLASRWQNCWRLSVSQRKKFTAPYLAILTITLQFLRILGSGNNGSRPQTFDWAQRYVDKLAMAHLVPILKGIKPLILSQTEANTTTHFPHVRFHNLWFPFSNPRPCSRIWLWYLCFPAQSHGQDYRRLWWYGGTVTSTYSSKLIIRILHRSWGLA